MGLFGLLGCWVAVLFGFVPAEEEQLVGDLFLEAFYLLHSQIDSHIVIIDLRLLIIKEAQLLKLPTHHNKLILLIQLLDLFLNRLINLALGIINKMRIEPKQLGHLLMDLINDNILQLRHVSFLDHCYCHVDQEGEQEVVEIVG